MNLPNQYHVMDPWAELKEILDNPLPGKPSLMPSLSWKQSYRTESITSFDMFGEIHFKEMPMLCSRNAPLPPPIPQSLSTRKRSIEGGLRDNCATEGSANGIRQLGVSTNMLKEQVTDASIGNRLTSFNNKSLDSSNKKLGISMLDDVEDLLRGSSKNKNPNRYMRSYSDVGPSRMQREFPPPISTIGTGENPWVYFKSYRQDGRFILKKIRIPTQQCLRATRENGRLVLKLSHPHGDAMNVEAKDGDENENAVAGINEEVEKQVTITD